MNRHNRGRRTANMQATADILNGSRHAGGATCEQPAPWAGPSASAARPVSRLRSVASTSLCKRVERLLEQLLLGLARPVDGDPLDVGKGPLPAPKVVQAEVVRPDGPVVDHVQQPVDDIVAVRHKYQVYAARKSGADNSAGEPHLPEGLHVRLYLLYREGAAGLYAVQGGNDGERGEYAGPGQARLDLKPGRIPVPQHRWPACRGRIKRSATNS